MGSAKSEHLSKCDLNLFSFFITLLFCQPILLWPHPMFQNNTHGNTSIDKTGLIFLYTMFLCCCFFHFAFRIPEENKNPISCAMPNGQLMGKLPCRSWVAFVFTSFFFCCSSASFHACAIAFLLGCYRFIYICFVHGRPIPCQCPKRRTAHLPRLQTQNKTNKTTNINIMMA